MIDILKLREM